MSERSLPQYDPVTEVMLQVFRVNGRFLEKGDQLLEPLGLSSARMQVLGAIALAAKPLPIPQIADLMGISRQGALKQLRRLEEDGFVAPMKNPRHERSPLFELTRKGHDAYQETEALQAAWAANLTESLSAGDLNVTLRTLEALYNALAQPVPKNGLLR